MQQPDQWTDTPSEDLATKVSYYRDAGYVKRWHTVPHVVGQQSDAEHSAQALTLLFLLHPGTPSIDLAKAVLWHDSAEFWVGDTSSPALRHNLELRVAYHAAEEKTFDKYLPEAATSLSRLDDHDRSWLRGVDRLEGALFCEDQLRAGNTLFQDPLILFIRYILSAEETPMEIVDYIKRRSWTGVAV